MDETHTWEDLGCWTNYFIANGGRGCGFEPSVEV